MPIEMEISGIKFNCYPLSEVDFVDAPSVYMIINVETDGTWNVLDINGTGTFKKRILNHPRRTLWKDLGGRFTNLWICVAVLDPILYSRDVRVDFEKSLIEFYNPPCNRLFPTPEEF